MPASLLIRRNCNVPCKPRLQGLTTADRAPIVATMPRVLYLMLSCLKRRERAAAALEAWGARVRGGSRVAIAGDDALAAAQPEHEVWPCVKAGSPEDDYWALPRKVLDGFRRALLATAWDFVFKLDDDTFVVPERLEAVLDELDPARPMYVGGDGAEASSDWEHVRAPATALAPGSTPFKFRMYHGGAGYALTREALTTAWPALEEELSQAGWEDGRVGLAMHRAGVPAVHLGDGVLCAHRELGHVAFGRAATVHYLEPADHKFLAQLLASRPPEPFEVAAADVGWGGLGRAGALGYEDAWVELGGRRHVQAISAHAPSRVTLRLDPGRPLRLAGAINDSSPEGSKADAAFTICDPSGALLADHGTATRGRPTP